MARGELGRAATHAAPSAPRCRAAGSVVSGGSARGSVPEAAGPACSSARSAVCSERPPKSLAIWLLHVPLAAKLMPGGWARQGPNSALRLDAAEVSPPPCDDGEGEWGAGAAAMRASEHAPRPDAS